MCNLLVSLFIEINSVELSLVVHIGQFAIHRKPYQLQSWKSCSKKPKENFSRGKYRRILKLPIIPLNRINLPSSPPSGGNLNEEIGK